MKESCRLAIKLIHYAVTTPLGSKHGVIKCPSNQSDVGEGAWHRGQKSQRRRERDMPNEASLIQDIPPLLVVCHRGEIAFASHT